MTKILAWENEKLKEFNKLEVHERGLRHPAISVFLFCKDEILLQRRALGKYHTAGLWANTCCSHPNPGETTKSCSERRLNEELGIRDIKVEFHKTIEYKADVGNNLIENEVVDVFFGFIKEKKCTKNEPRPYGSHGRKVDWNKSTRGKHKSSLRKIYTLAKNLC